ncbi:hypothetical protein KSP39_PZI018666 [Platanthera zijinensis]|uniref:Reverse transcriptase domain-containing protein n=1 Tax=Platanthera zijinensis TaxID=2320716 RepID=A0AAP0FZM6_9ASPA
MSWRPTMEAIHLLRRLIDNYQERKQVLHMPFIDLEKAYDRVPREILWRVLEKRGVNVSYIDIIKDMYANLVTRVRTVGGLTQEFPINVSLHQGSVLSPYLFTLILDELTRHIQQAIPWCLLFVDDIVLVDEMHAGVNAKLESWRDTLDKKGFSLSKTKIEYMELKFSSAKRTNDFVIKLGDQGISQSECFKYLGSIVQKYGDIDKDVTHKIQAGWLKWRGASGILCDRKVPLKLKGKFYRTAIRPVMLCGSECWAVNCVHEQNMRVTKMRMLRWMCGHTRLDRIKNEYIKNRTGVALIAEKMREGRLRWFGHVQRRPLEGPHRRCESLVTMHVKRRRCRPIKTWNETIRKDMMYLGISEIMTQDRVQWRQRIHIADPTIVG